MVRSNSSAWLALSGIGIAAVLALSIASGMLKPTVDRRTTTIAAYCPSAILVTPDHSDEVVFAVFADWHCVLVEPAATRFASGIASIETC
jgi:hypothetical protein